MKKKFISKQALSCALISALFVSPQLLAKNIKGRALNQQGEPVANAVVKVHNTNKVTKTDDNGFFSFDLEPGRVVIDVEGNFGEHFHQEIEVTESNNDVYEISLQEKPEHKLIITANPLDHTTLDMATPTTLIAADELTLKKAGTLGEVLQYEPGVNMASFGPAVSRPVIRGLSGSRVLLTNNQMVIQDASTTSADHDAGIEPLLAEQIEVVKGPATLLYGSGAIGGVVNVVDRKINDDVDDGFSGGFETRIGDSVTGERTGILTLDHGGESFNWHADLYQSEMDSIKIPSPGESNILRAKEGEPLEFGESVLENSDIESKGGSLGFTAKGDWGHAGLAFSAANKYYGLPGHSHAHEEHEGEHEAGHEHEHEEHGHEEGVFLDMEQKRADFQAVLLEPMNSFDSLFIGASHTDYEHVELEEEGAGTRFKNEALEVKSYLKHLNWSGWSGVWGVQFNERKFSAIGEEAFVPPSKKQSQALFMIEEKNINDHKFELGLRFEKNKVNANGHASRSEDGISYSLGYIYTLSKHNKLAVNYSRAVRFASVEELYSLGRHAATQSYEIGNDRLDKETSNNLDLSYRFENDHLHGEVNVYYNKFNDYIFGQTVTEGNACIPLSVDSHDLEEVQIICYQQADAEFNGVEFQLNYKAFEGQNQSLSFGLLGDFVDAELNNGQNIPRIPPKKVGFLMHYDYQDFSADVSYLRYSEAKDLAPNELKTLGFDDVNVDFSYRVPMNQSDLFIFLKVRNALNEEARDHTSFLKDLAPRAKRNILLGARYTF